METHKGCTYWYQISMHVDKKGDGVYMPVKVRIPVSCIGANTDESICTFLDPSCSSVRTLVIKNEDLYDSPYPSAACR